LYYVESETPDEIVGEIVDNTMDGKKQPEEVLNLQEKSSDPVISTVGDIQSAIDNWFRDKYKKASEFAEVKMTREQADEILEKLIPSKNQ
jgi:hypothetical protein